MKFVKLIAKKGTWFKEGTEVFDYNFSYNDKVRIFYKDWEEATKLGGICVRGIHVIEDEIDAKNRSSNIGDEVVDGEYCLIDEFEVEII